MRKVEFRCDLSGTAAPFPHFWEHTIGSDHAPMILRADCQAQLRRCHDELGFRYLRFHGLLSDDMGTLICHKEKLLYSFFNADQIFDFLLSNGMKPFVEFSFMPQTLASGDKTVFRYHGNVTPPKDYNQWASLIRTLAEHWLERYGIEEVSTWYFEVWNEPNVHHFWTGTREQYFELYRRTALALKSVDERLRVGGPATAKNQWIEEFIAFCSEHHVPVDFISTHHYPTDVVEGTSLGEEEDITEAHLAQSRRSILREWAQDANRSAQGHPLHYTEWNTSSNPRDPLHDEPYAAAFVTKTIMEAKGTVESYSFWTFSDIFAENYFPSVPFHGGFGLLNLHGIAKPTYRAFQLLHRLGTEQFLVDGLHETVDAWVVGGRGSTTVLLTNHALPRHPIQTSQVAIRLIKMPQPRAVHLERIDEYHANAKRVWREMGEPKHLKTNELKRLEVASQTVKEPLQWKAEEESIYLNIELPPHAVAAITLEFTLK